MLEAEGVLLLIKMLDFKDTLEPGSAAKNRQTGVENTIIHMHAWI